MKTMKIYPGKTLYIGTLENGFNIAIRPSGTEPKDKILFGCGEPNSHDLEKSKSDVLKRLSLLGNGWSRMPNKEQKLNKQKIFD